MLRNATVLAIALVTASGCALEEEPADTASNEATLASGDAVAAVPSYTLHVSGSPFSTITVTHTNHNGDTVHNSCRTCDLPYLKGTKLKIRVTFPINEIDCMQFGSWNQSPCAGQGSTCNATINSNISATVRWIPLLGCDPR